MSVRRQKDLDYRHSRSPRSCQSVSTATRAVSEWDRRCDVRRCKECPKEEELDKLKQYKCCRCKNDLAKVKFHESEVKKKCDRRKCIECCQKEEQVDQQMKRKRKGVAPTGTTCLTCQYYVKDRSGEVNEGIGDEQEDCQ